MPTIDEHLNALWYLTLNGIAWRALPSEFGKWGSVFQYFNRLSLAGFFGFLEERLICGNESEAVFYDSTHHKVHQHANGPGTAEDQAIGKSRGGLNTKLHMAVDALGRLAARIMAGAPKPARRTGLAADQGSRPAAVRRSRAHAASSSGSGGCSGSSHLLRQ